MQQSGSPNSTGGQHAGLEDDWSTTDGVNPDLIDEELQRILKSRHFRHSKRASQFLRFVVEQKIHGNQEQVKERLIGVELYGRKADYPTGDDPVVRVQGGEVRRRLELYQNDIEPDRTISIELPLGSYVPVFRLLSPEPHQQNSWNEEHLEASPEAPEKADETVAAVPPTVLAVGLHSPSAHLTFSARTPKRSLRPYTAKLLGVCAALLLLLLGSVYLYQSPNTPAACLRAFWSPLFATKRPALIWMGRPAVYTPHLTLFQRYATTHPGAFSSAIDRHNQILHLDPNETIRWGDLSPITNSGPAVGGVRAGMNVSALLGKHNVPFDIRFGNEASFTDLRDTPSVIVGAMDSLWIMQMSADLHFAMTEVDGRLWIKETNSGRMWGDHAIPDGWRDYGLITRQLNSPTGQFLVGLEGITDGGTQACSELVTDPESLRSILKGVPAGWEKKNLQMVVVTDIIDGRSGPPRLVAFYSW